MGLITLHKDMTTLKLCNKSLLNNASRFCFSSNDGHIIRSRRCGERPLSCRAALIVRWYTCCILLAVTIHAHTKLAYFCLNSNRFPLKRLIKRAFECFARVSETLCYILALAYVRMNKGVIEIIK